jgi:hypothetical protein
MIRIALSVGYGSNKMFPKVLEGLVLKCEGNDYRIKAVNFLGSLGLNVGDTIEIQNSVVKRVKTDIYEVNKGEVEIVSLDPSRKYSIIEYDGYEILVDMTDKQILPNVYDLS